MDKENIKKAGAPEKPVLLYPVAVEGKYDKIKLDSLFEGKIFTTGGFSLFNDTEKREFFKKLAEKSPVIVLVDSDSGGAQIRNLLKNLLPPDRQIHLYIPQVAGKEKRKPRPSKQVFLGVEGTDSALLLELLAPYTAENGASPRSGAPLRRIDLYERGYEGADGSREKRRALCRRCGLPENLSTSALLDALNLLYDREELEKIL